jgi:hypothetical protein
MVCSMPEFVRPRHKLVLKALRALNAETLCRAECFFCGGTRIALALHEYRESADIDFLCASRTGYRALRAAVSDRSLGEIAAPGLKLACEWSPTATASARFLMWVAKNSNSRSSWKRASGSRTTTSPGYRLRFWTERHALGENFWPMQIAGSISRCWGAISSISRSWPRLGRRTVAHWFGSSERSVR